MTSVPSRLVLPPIPDDAVLWRIDPMTGKAVATKFGQRKRRRRR